MSNPQNEKILEISYQLEYGYDKSYKWDAIISYQLYHGSECWILKRQQKEIVANIPERIRHDMIFYDILLYCLMMDLKSFKFCEQLSCMIL